MTKKISYENLTIAVKNDQESSVREPHDRCEEMTKKISCDRKPSTYPWILQDHTLSIMALFRRYSKGIIQLLYMSVPYTAIVSLYKVTNFYDISKE